MNALLEEIFTTRHFTNSNGQQVNVDSETSRDQCQYLQDIILKNHFTDTLEIGFAYGTSTLSIVEAVAANNGRHTVIDKFEINSYGGNGLDLVRQAGYADRLEFVEKFCYEILPEYMLAGRKFDFAYIDSTKQFDWLMIDFFYIDKMLKIGGIVTFDDVNFESIRKLLRYISRFPGYKVYSQFPDNQPVSVSRKMIEWLKVIPKAAKILRPEILTSDRSLGLNANCVALQKIDEDKRKWDWHLDF
jgi:predicted O-methyltransferase YrrM